MGRPVDLKDDEVLINKHILITEDLLDLCQREADRSAGGNLSLLVRRMARKHFGIKEKK